MPGLHMQLGLLLFDTAVWHQAMASVAYFVICESRRLACPSRGWHLNEISESLSDIWVFENTIATCHQSCRTEPSIGEMLNR